MLLSSTVAMVGKIKRQAQRVAPSTEHAPLRARSRGSGESQQELVRHAADPVAALELPESLALQPVRKNGSRPLSLTAEIWLVIATTRWAARGSPPTGLFDRLPETSVPLDEGFEHVRNQRLHADRLTVDLRVERRITLQTVSQGGRQDNSQAACRCTSQRSQAQFGRALAHCEPPRAKKSGW